MIFRLNYYLMTLKERIIYLFNFYLNSVHCTRTAILSPCALHLSALFSKLYDSLLRISWAAFDRILDIFHILLFLLTEDWGVWTVDWGACLIFCCVCCRVCCLVSCALSPHFTKCKIENRNTHRLDFLPETIFDEVIRSFLVDEVFPRPRSCQNQPNWILLRTMLRTPRNRNPEVRWQHVVCTDEIWDEMRWDAEVYMGEAKRVHYVRD